MDSGFLLRAFAAIFAIMNPLLALPQFLSLTEGYDEARQKRSAVRCVLYSAILCLVILVTGPAVLNAFGIDVDGFRIAGGLVLLTIGLGMLNGTNTAHGGTHHEQQQVEKTADAPPVDISFFPMAFPMMVGPGTITAIVVLTGQGHGIMSHVLIGLSIVTILAMLLVTLWFAPVIGHHMSATLRSIMTRLMGMILAAMAVEMLITGLKHVFPGLAH